MSFLIDTNILLRSADPTHPMHADAINATTSLRGQGHQLCIIPQNLIEFWNVYTRPADKNGLGHTPGEAAAEVNRLKGLFLLLPDTLAIYSEWERLVLTYGVRGVNVHDARLVAAMVVHGLTHILTFNIRDFARYARSDGSASDGCAIVDFGGKRNRVSRITLGFSLISVSETRFLFHPKSG